MSCDESQRAVRREPRKMNLPHFERGLSARASRRVFDSRGDVVGAAMTEAEKEKSAMLRMEVMGDMMMG